MMLNCIKKELKKEKNNHTPPLNKRNEIIKIYMVRRRRPISDAAVNYTRRICSFLPKAMAIQSGCAADHWSILISDSAV